MRTLRTIAAATLVLLSIAPAVMASADPAHDARTLDRTRPVAAFVAIARWMMERIDELARVGPEMTPGGSPRRGDSGGGDDDPPDPPPVPAGPHLTPGG